MLKSARISLKCSSNRTQTQGFSELSEVGARGLLNLGKKLFGPSELVKFDAVRKNWTTILNEL